MRLLASASLAGIAAGLVAGVLARLAMRLIVVVKGEAPEFSLTGTVGIVSTFVLMACALGVLYLLATRWSDRGPARAWWALAGVAVLALAVFVTPLRQEVARGPAFISLFVPVGMLLGWGPAALGSMLAVKLPSPSSGLASAGYALLSIPGLVSVVALPLLIIFGVLQLTGVIPVPSS